METWFEAYRNGAPNGTAAKKIVLSGHKDHRAAQKQQPPRSERDEEFWKMVADHIDEEADQETEEYGNENYVPHTVHQAVHITPRAL